MLPIRLSYGHGKQSTRIEMLVDSGADDCIFRADIAKVIGIPKVEKGPMAEMGGIAAGVKIPVYYHRVKLWCGYDMVEITAGFSDQLSTAGLLGRRGFFEHYVVTFNPANNPPGFEIQRIGRA